MLQYQLSWFSDSLPHPILHVAFLVLPSNLSIIHLLPRFKSFINIALSSLFPISGDFYLFKSLVEFWKETKLDMYLIYVFTRKGDFKKKMKM